MKLKNLNFTTGIVSVHYAVVVVEVVLYLLTNSDDVYFEYLDKVPVSFGHMVQGNVCLQLTG